MPTPCDSLPNVNLPKVIWPKLKTCRTQLDYFSNFLLGNFFSIDLGTMTLSRMTLRRMTLCRMALCQMTRCQIRLCQMTLCQMTQCRMTICKMTICQKYQSETCSTKRDFLTKCYSAEKLLANFHSIAVRQSAQQHFAKDILPQDNLQQTKI
jgi:hypothetical protein